MRSRQRGIALIIALVVLALSATLATAMVWDSNLAQRRSENILHGAQAQAYAYGAEAWAAQILRRDAEKTQTDSLTEPWAMQLPPLPVDGGSITGRIEDMDGRFNINDLVDSKGKVQADELAQFQRLLTLVGLDPKLADAVLDWIDPDTQPRFPDGAEDQYYGDLQPPYAASDRPMTSTSELMLVKGFDREAFARLAPYVTALPTTTPINVNTAPALVLQSLADGITPAEIESVQQVQVNKGFKDVSEFHQIVQQNTQVRLSVASSYFLVTARVAVGTTSLTLYSLLARDANGGTRTLRRTFGTL